MLAEVYSQYKLPLMINGKKINAIAVTLLLVVVVIIIPALQGGGSFV
jgi:hypothetical protein